MHTRGQPSRKLSVEKFRYVPRWFVGILVLARVFSTTRSRRRSLLQAVSSRTRLRHLCLACDARPLGCDSLVLGSASSRNRLRHLRLHVKRH